MTNAPAPAEVPMSGRTQIAPGVPRALNPLGRPTMQPGAYAELVDELAVGVTTPAELATRFKVGRGAIYGFRTTHKAEIDARRAELGDAFASVTGLWVADKEARMVELQAAAERMIRLLEAADRPRVEGEPAADVSMVPEFTRTLVGILHEAAEQLGQLPTRVQVQSTTVVQYEINGVDTSQL